MVGLSIGFTGSRNTPYIHQVATLENLIKQISTQVEMLAAHHGNCIGADSIFHDISTCYCDLIVIHPPINESKSAMKETVLSLSKTLVICTDPLDYMERNQKIVDCSDMLIAIPMTKEHRRSGTWSTVRKARKKGIPIIIIDLNGYWYLDKE